MGGKGGEGEVEGEGLQAPPLLGIVSACLEQCPSWPPNSGFPSHGLFSSLPKHPFTETRGEERKE